MPALDPELARLDEQYTHLSNDLTNEVITYDDAVRTLSQMTTTDSAGNIWGLTEQGEFYCQPPGGARQVTDPSLFVGGRRPLGPSQPQQAAPAWGTPPQPQQWGADPQSAQPTPSPWGSPESQGFTPTPQDPPWARNDLSAPPGGPQPLEVHPMGGPGFDPRRPPTPDVPGWPTPGGGGPSQDYPPQRGQGRKPRQPGRGSQGAGQLYSSVVNFISTHKKSVIIGAIVVLIIVLALAFPHKPKATTTTTTSLPGVAPSSLPTSSTSTTAPLPKVPTNTDASRVVSALASGVPSQAEAVIVSPGTLAQVTLETDAFYGYIHAPSHLHVAVATPTSSRSVVTQEWVLENSANTEEATTTVTWDLVSGHWKLASWPTFS